MGQRQNIEKAHGGPSREDQDELASNDAQEDRLSSHKVAEFHAVAAAMQAILDGASADGIAREMTPEQQAALEQLYTARNARDAETGGYVSAIERKSRLNQALMCLQPVLALARRPDFRSGKPIYEALAARIGEVRKEISSAILAQVMPRRRRKKVEEIGDEAGGGEDPGNEGSGEDPGDGGSEASGDAGGPAAGDGEPGTQDARQDGAQDPIPG